MTKRQIPALENWFHTDNGKACLTGTRCVECGTYYFPREFYYCRNPHCDSTGFDEVSLSRTGKIWSYTNACYQPPAPYPAGDPFTPFAIVAVELDKERMIVLGQVVAGIDMDQLRVGQEVEVVTEPLYEDDECEYLIWKWRPTHE